MSEQFIHNEILIKAPIASVWQALVDPAMTQQYMYGCEVICDWQIGSPILWRGVQDGVVYVKGHLAELEEEKVFAFTVFDPLASYEDIPANYLTATYTLAEEEDHTKLTVTQGDYSKVADGQKRYEDSLAQGGWGAVLEQIQQLVEE